MTRGGPRGARLTVPSTTLAQVEGCYNIGKMVADEWMILVGWSKSDLIRLGRQTNILRVKRET